jgi:hypothetical protein
VCALQGAQSKLVNIMSTLGMSTNLIKVITRRENSDRIVFWVGVSSTLLVLGLLYYFYVR